MMWRRRVKIGIDVGGTFTHAVAVDADEATLVATAMVPTTHTAEEGVARGVVESMHRLIEARRSTLAMSSSSRTARPRPPTPCSKATSPPSASSAWAAAGRAGGRGARRGWTTSSSRRARPSARAHRFLDTATPLTDDRLASVVDDLRREGAEVFVATEAFGVDDGANEHRAADFVRSRGWLATAASDISQLYGLKVRTRTAVINASMLPRMLETAERTEQAVRESGLTCPLMVMRSDGGIMDIAQMRRRPILTMLSGPAAGVAAALAFTRISDGIFLEVGGTSTDISVVRNGRPTVRSAEVGGHRLFVRTLDIRTVGIGGGSMVRVRGRQIADVGPRSAHIAGLAYPSFSEIPARASLALAAGAAEAAGSGRLRRHSRRRVARAPALTYTTTDAANVLGLVEGYARATSPAVERLSSWLAGELGTTPHDLAQADPATRRRRRWRPSSPHSSTSTVSTGVSSRWSAAAAAPRSSSAPRRRPWSSTCASRTAPR